MVGSGNGVSTDEGGASGCCRGGGRAGRQVNADAMGSSAYSLHRLFENVSS